LTLVHAVFIVKYTRTLEETKKAYTESKCCCCYCCWWRRQC